MALNRRIPAAVIALLVPFLISWEGLDLVAHHQAIDPPGVITFCDGATNYDHPEVKPGTRFTKAECYRYVIKDLPKYEAMLSRCVDTSKLPTHRHAALLDATYNLGPGAICKATRHRPSIATLLKRGEVARACKALMDYTYANHKFLRGLYNRRKAEYAWCMRGD